MYIVFEMDGFLRGDGLMILDDSMFPGLDFSGTRGRIVHK